MSKDQTTTVKSRSLGRDSHGDEAVIGAGDWRGLYMEGSLMNYIYYEHARDYEKQYKSLLEQHQDLRA